MSSSAAFFHQIAFGVSLSLIASSALAGGDAAFSGKYKATAKQDAAQTGDVDGHMLVLTQATGVNESTGPSDFMGGAKVVEVDFGDIVKGVGPQNGYITFANDKEKMSAKFQGDISTAMAPDGKTPMISFKGDWTQTGGTGAAAGLNLSGTYGGNYTSPTEYICEWQAKRNAVSQ